VHLPEWFRFLEKYYLIAYSLVVLAMVIIAPWGAIGAMERWRERWRPSPLPSLPEAVPLPPRSDEDATTPLLEIEAVSDCRRLTKCR